MYRISTFIFIVIVAASQFGCAAKDSETRRLESFRQAYIEALREKIQRNWQRPTGSFEASECEVYVLQAPGGIVLDVKFGACKSSSKKYRDSIEQAIFKAEPFPKPGDPSLFDRELLITFIPAD